MLWERGDIPLMPLKGMGGDRGDGAGMGIQALIRLASGQVAA